MKRVIMFGALLLIGAVAIVGCKDESITKYKVPKVVKAKVPAPATDTMAQAVPNPHGETATAPTKDIPYNWIVPSGWIQKNGTGMRMATFDIPVEGQQLSCSIIKLPGQSGTVADNINRWRGQVGLDNLDEQGAVGSAKVFETAFGEIYFSKIVNAANVTSAILATILPTDEYKLFVKIQGAPALLVKVEADFIAFSKSITAK